MQLAAALLLMAIIFLVAYASHKDRPDIVLVVLLLPTALIYQGIEAGIEWIAWLLIPVALYIPFGVRKIFKSEESITAEERRAMQDLRRARSRDGKSSAGVYLTTGIFAGGLVLLGFVAGEAPFLLRTVLGFAWIGMST